MATAETARLIASLEFIDKFSPAINKLDSGLSRIEGGLTRTRAMAGAFGAVLGAGFAIAAKGAAELDTATRQFQADTGATAEEAAKASDAIASMYRGNLQGFDQIGATLGKVTTDLGLAGKAAEETTALFLNFATATGIDSAQGVSLADDALDAWNMTAADAAPLLDKLVASHQKYGGSISENFDALARLAPSVQALGGNIDDAIGLLNLFEASGLDSGKAMAALNIAVKKLQPGQTINDLVAQVASIEDPTLRAQKAIELFGARGGVGLANALRPGIDSLQDFVPAAEDVAGATKEAADAIKSGFGAQFQLIIKNAGGALAEFGTNFGPLLLVAGTFGPKMAAGIAAGFGGISAMLVPKMIAMMAPVMASTGLASGTALGTAIAAAVPLGLAALAAIPIVLTFQIISGDIAKQSAELEKQTAAFVEDATLEGLRKAREGLAYQIKTAGEGINLGDLLFFPSAISKALGPGGVDLMGAKATMQRQLDSIDAAIENATKGVGSAAADGLKSGAAEVRDAAGNLIAPVSELPAKVRKSKSELIAALLEPLEMTDSAISQAWNLEKTVPTTAERTKVLKDFLNNPKVTAGLKDSRAAVRLGFQQAVKLALDELAGYTSPAKAFADTQMNAYVKQIGTWRSKVYSAWAFATRPPGGTPNVNAATGFVIPPGTASGGIFRRPTIRLIGEAGPEAVVPLSRLGPAALNLNVSTSISARQNDHGTRLQRRWGPTPTTANVR